MKRHMIVIIMLLTFLGSQCLAQTDQPTIKEDFQPSTLNQPGKEYPQVNSQGYARFRIEAPQAQSVSVSLGGREGTTLKKTEDGVWTYTSEPQDYGYHNYWIIVDGAIVLDPATDGFIGYSHDCSGFEVPDPEGDFYDLKDVPHGDVLIKNYFSKVTDAWRMAFIYLPPGYDKNTSTRYPVIYLQHGGGKDQRVWFEMGRTNLILDDMIASDENIFDTLHCGNNTLRRLCTIT